jgi:hypothetical protein
MKIASLLRALAALAVLGLAHTPAPAGAIVSNGKLVSLCRAGKNTAEWGYCFGYVRGVAAWMATLGMDVNDDGTVAQPTESLCPERDSDFDTSVMVQLFLKWAESHPAALADSATFGVAQALQQRWPCRS